MENKVLKHTLKTTEGEIIEVTNAIALKKANLTSLKTKAKALRKRIKEAETSHTDLIVTDHAIVRYFERVLGVDLNEVRGEIRKKEIKKKVVDNTIITVLGKTL